MVDTQKAKARGRPRSFDPDAALDTAQALFQAQGYEGVGVAALTQALGINPPSFYAAFGSKAELFDRVIARYASCGLPMDQLLAPGRPPAEALTALLDMSAHVYTEDPTKAGCMVLEAARSCEPESAARGAVWLAASRERIAQFVAATHPAQADMISDYVVSAMSGLSAAARNGWGEDRLRAIAAISARGLSALLAEA